MHRRVRSFDLQLCRLLGQRSAATLPSVAPCCNPKSLSPLDALLFYIRQYVIPPGFVETRIDLEDDRTTNHRDYNIQIGGIT